MRLPLDPQLPTSDDVRQLKTRLTDLLRRFAAQINGISEGSVSAVTNAMTSPPTTQTWAQGDFIRNATPAELGTAGGKYIVIGWTCTAGGTPGTWVQNRTLTGN